MANSERDEHQLFTGLFENVFERNSTPLVFDTNDETRNKSLGKITELSVAREHFDWKPHNSVPVRGQLIQEICHDTQLLVFFIVHHHTNTSRNIFSLAAIPRLLYPYKTITHLQLLLPGLTCERQLPVTSYFNNCKNPTSW